MWKMQMNQERGKIAFWEASPINPWCWVFLYINSIVIHTNNIKRSTLEVRWGSLSKCTSSEGSDRYERKRFIGLEHQLLQATSSQQRGCFGHDNHQVIPLITSYVLLSSVLVLMPDSLIGSVKWPNFYACICGKACKFIIVITSLCNRFSLVFTTFPKSSLVHPWHGLFLSVKDPFNFQMTVWFFKIHLNKMDRVSGNASNLSVCPKNSLSCFPIIEKQERFLLMRS